MSTPITDKKKQLRYIKSRLSLVDYLIEQLNTKSDLTQEDFEIIETELKEVVKKTKIFNNRND